MKRLELLHELVPKAVVIAVLIDPTFPASSAELPQLQVAARSIGKRIVVARASTEREVDLAFGNLVAARPGGLIVSGSPLFTSQSRRLTALAAQSTLPAIYDVREHVAAGGLMSYSASLTGAYRQAGIYAGKILNGAKPAELPVLQPTKFELVLNLKTAKELGLAVPQSLLLRPHEVIE